MPTVAIDAREARVARPRGSGRYVRALVAAVRGLGAFELREDAGGGVGWPLRLARARPDLVHGAGGALPLLRTCPAVVSVHDVAETAAARRSARSAELVLCASTFVAAAAVERYGLDPARVRVVPHAPALPRGELPMPDGPPYLLAVGGLGPAASRARLSAAFGALRASELPEHRLVLVGAADAQLRAPGVEVAGWVDDARLDALMRGADVLVQPGLQQGFGLAVLEAMARGVPVAAADAGALPETCGDAAELFAPLDPDALAAAVLRARARRAALAAAGRERAALFSWEGTAQATALVYRELL
jgi:glycosyltransferase involved in cell wall biosynthesis